MENLLQLIQHKSTSALLALLTVILHLGFVSLPVRLSSVVSLLYKIFVLDDLQTATQFWGSILLAKVDINDYVHIFRAKAVGMGVNCATARACGT